MTNKAKFLLSVLCLLAACHLSAQAAAGTRYSAGLRYHTQDKEFETYPFQDGDLSYLIGMEFHEGIGYWQLLLGYTPSLDAPEDPEAPEVKSVITPQLNLILQDRGWLAGSGILASYVEDDLDKDWTDIYWQTMIGYQFSFGLFDAELLAVYPFEEWSVFTEFDFDNLEWNFLLKTRF